jgi:excisionase family DNA binding protein
MLENNFIFQKNFAEMSKTIELREISISELREMFSEIIEEKFAHLQPKVQSHNKYITRDELCHILRISKPTSHNLVKNGIIRAYKIGGKLLFRNDEIENSLQEIKSSKYKRS